MKMVIERSVNEQAHTGAICWEGWQAVPVDVETAIVKCVDRLMKHVALVDIVAVRQARPNR